MIRRLILAWVIMCAAGLVLAATARAQQCPPNKPNARAVVDLAAPPACDITRCPAKLVCNVGGDCYRIPQKCPQCDPRPSVVTCLSQQEVNDAERGSRQQQAIGKP